jgi:hypothetical protein
MEEEITSFQPNRMPDTFLSSLVIDSADPLGIDL